MQGMPVSLPESFSQNPQGADVGLWPLAWGWWALLALCLILLTLGVVWCVKRVKQQKAKKQAIKALKALPLAQQNNLQYCNQILKRVFMSYFPRGQVESLHSQQWTAFLAAQLKPAKTAKFQVLFQALNSGLYRRTSGEQASTGSEDTTQLVGLAIDYIKLALPPGKKQLIVAEGASHD